MVSFTNVVIAIVAVASSGVTAANCPNGRLLCGWRLASGEFGKFSSLTFNSMIGV